MRIRSFYHWPLFVPGIGHPGTALPVCWATCFQRGECGGCRLCQAAACGVGAALCQLFQPGTRLLV